MLPYQLLLCGFLHAAMSTMESSSGGSFRDENPALSVENARRAVLDLPCDI
jgi:hypothetical protein